MGLYKLAFRDGTFETYEELEKKEKKKVLSIFKDIMRNGAADGIAHTEPLRGDLSGSYSKSVDKKNRVTFTLVGDYAEIISVESHYGDK